MKRLIALVIMLFVFASTASAETVRTCSSVYGGGEVCGETTTTTTTIEHKTVNTGINDLELWQVLAIMATLASISTLLYKLTYKFYILD